MPHRLSRLCLLTATMAMTAWAQSTPTVAATPSSRIPAARSTNKAAKPAKTGVPDPDLLDGSAFDKEKRPITGMLAEIEMGEQEGPQGAKVSPDSGAAGSQSPDAEKNEANQSGGGGAPPPSGPSAEAQGAQVANLKVPEGAQPADGAQASSPRDMQIGDATLQIQTMDKANPNVVGVQSSNSQQYEKKLPQGGQQTDNRNRGVEKGRVVPKGL